MRLVVNRCGRAAVRPVGPGTHLWDLWDQSQDDRGVPRDQSQDDLVNGMTCVGPAWDPWDQSRDQSRDDL